MVPLSCQTMPLAWNHPTSSCFGAMCPILGGLGNVSSCARLGIENFMRMPKNAGITAKSKLNCPQCRRYPPILTSRNNPQFDHKGTKEPSHTVFIDPGSTAHNRVLVRIRSRLPPRNLTPTREGSKKLFSRHKKGRKPIAPQSFEDPELNKKRSASNLKSCLSLVSSPQPTNTLTANRWKCISLPGIRPTPNDHLRARHRSF